MSMKSRVSEKGQVTIPKVLRDRLGIRAGQELDFREDRGKLIAVKVTPSDPLDQVTGILETDRTTDQLIDDLRGPVDGV